MDNKTETIIRSLTPIFLAGTGLIVALSVILSGHRLTEGQWAAGLSLASSAIAAAAGAAQSSAGAKSDLVQKGLINNEAEIQRES